MSRPPDLSALLSDAARRHPEKIAVEDPGTGCLRYRQLDELAERYRDALCGAGVTRGDRVGLLAPKSPALVAAIFAILRCGGAYVPADPSAPPARTAQIFRDCAVRAVILDEVRRKRLTPSLDLERSAALPGPGELEIARPRVAADGQVPTDSLAYLLYTSGSTGRPKGVMLTHDNALAFLDWCSNTFSPGEGDRFSSHAPFHFDLSILDLFLPLRHGATLVLIADELARQPGHLARFIVEQRLSVWYSTPSVLSLMVQSGRLARLDSSPLRLVLFAGEVFPTKYLRALRAAWPGPRMFNLYGPTETNVCTFQEIPARIPEDRREPYPIGRACSHARTRVCDERGAEVAPGRDGELWVSGRSVMAGYWNLPDANARVFFRDAEGTRWYRTGDLVREQSDGSYIFLGRTDRMVKRRGYRHSIVKEAAVLAQSDPDGGTRILAFLATTTGEKLSTIELKRFCAEQLPLYMVPDGFVHQPVLPRTSNDKIDYQGLTALL